MDGLKPEITSFLREAMLRKASRLNGTEDEDMIFSSVTGFAGLASIAGGFDQVLLAAGGGGGALPAFQVTVLLLHDVLLVAFCREHLKAEVSLYG